MIQETLQQIGLSKNETKIYLALLELGPSLMGEICGKTKIHRRNVYDSIEMLKDKGFASSTLVNNRNVFEAVNPKRILEILDERKTNVEGILPLLINNNNKKQSKVKVYSGSNGRKVIFEDKLNYKEEQYVLSAHKPSKKHSNYVENYHIRRIKEKIHLKMLFIREDKESAKIFSKYKFVKVRLLPELFTSPIAINIYGNKVAFLLGSGSVEPISILIEDQELANNFKAQFEMLWKLSKEI
jgi:HTH-type transcriptional regulator, sugar sensing transcriptional regulator